jgi:hypothetical protein
VVLLAAGAILWDSWEDELDEDDGPPPWWCHIAAPADDGEPCPGVTMEHE